MNSTAFKEFSRLALVKDAAEKNCERVQSLTYREPESEKGDWPEYLDLEVLLNPGKVRGWRRGSF